MKQGYGRSVSTLRLSLSTMFGVVLALVLMQSTASAQFCSGCTGNSTYEIVVGPDWVSGAGNAITTETITNNTTGSSTQNGHTTAPGATSTAQFAPGFGGSYTLTQLDLRTNFGTLCCVALTQGTQIYPSGVFINGQQLCYKVTVTCNPGGAPCITVRLETYLGAC